MKKIMIAGLVELLAFVSMADIVVKEFDFNTVGSDVAARQDWSANKTTDMTTGNGFVDLQVTNAIQGTETVLTTADIDSADVKLYYRGADIVLPGGATSWGTMEIRMRQTDMVNPVGFSKTGTLIAYGGSGSLFGTSGPLVANFPTTASGTLGSDPTVPYTVTSQANEWEVFSFDLSALGTNPIKAGWRLDPVQNVDGNFEIDYIKITAVPEPATIGLLGFGALFAALIRRLRA
jgi:hypothetical protein